MTTVPINYVDTRKYTVALSHDEWAEDPLQWMSPEERGAWFVMYHNQYDLPMEIDVDTSEYESWTDMSNNHPEIKGRPVKFVRWYEHSGIAVSLRDDESGHDWDAGIVGLIVGDDDNAIEDAFTDWAHYVQGDIYNATIETEDGRHIDSIGGLYGYEAVEIYIEDMIPGAEYEVEYK